MADRNLNSGAGSSKNLMDLINFPRGAIGKRGLPATRNTRLPSIRNPRDLTLGGVSLGVAPKRTYVPNIPVRREKPQDSSTSSDKGKQKNADSPHNRRKDSKSDRGRGRGKNRPEYIQTGGIFSEGIGEGIRKPSSSRFSRESSGAPKLQKPVMPVIKKEVKDENDDKDVLHNLLRDDFIDDDSDDDKDVLNPVFVPLKHSIYDNLSVKNDPGDLKPTVHIKKEKKEIKSDVEVPMEVCDKKPDVATKSEQLEAHELFMAEDITEDKQLLFFQFPDVLGVPPQPEETQRSQNKNPQDASTSQEAVPQNADEVKLADFPEGYIGKLQILKSGKTRLVLGSLVLDVKMGSPFNTLQDVVSVRTGISGGDMTVLGHVHHKLVCMPDVENLMSQCSL